MKVMTLKFKVEWKITNLICRIEFQHFISLHFPHVHLQNYKYVV